MFDKNLRAPSSPNQNPNQSPQPQVPNVSTGEPKKPVEDMFSPTDSVPQKNINEAQKQENISNILKPETSNANVSPANASQIPPNLPAAKVGLTPEKHNPKNKGVFFVLVIIIFLLIALGAGAWYYFNYLAVPDVIEDQIIDEKENEQAAQENININTPVVNENVNINKNISPTTIIFDSDLDSDGLTDDEEKKLGTNINLADSDNDGLLDREEIRIYKTNPLNPDTDGDGHKDGDEIKGGYNPNGPGKLDVKSMFN